MHCIYRQWCLGLFTFSSSTDPFPILNVEKGTIEKQAMAVGGR